MPAFNRDTPIIDLIVEREVFIPRGPLREKQATQEMISQLASRFVWD